MNTPPSRRSWEKHWFEEPPERLHRVLFDHVERIEQDQAYVARYHEYYSEVYSGRETHRWASPGAHFDPRRVSVNDNLVKQLIDSAQSIVARDLPRVKVLSSGGSFSDQRKARGLTKFLDGEMEHKKVRRITPEAFRSMGIVGTGGVKVFGRHGRLCVERVNMDDVVVKEDDCIAGSSPREIHHRVVMDVRAACRKFPEHTDAILSSMNRRSYGAGWRIPHDKVVMIESYRLRDDPQESGVYALVCEQETLDHAAWDHDWIPFEFQRWETPLNNGWYGAGIAEETVDLQILVNHLNKKVRMGHDLIVNPSVYVEVGSRTLAEQWTNRIGGFRFFRGQQPFIHTPTAFGPETYNYIERLRQLGQERLGISRMTSQGFVPPGVQSGAAVREYRAVESGRWAEKSAANDDFFKRIALLMIRATKELVSEGHTPMTKARLARNLVQEIPWADVDLDEDRFVLTVETSSLFALSPSARMEKVQEWRAAGHIDKEEFLALSGNPDLERWSSRAQAPHELTEMVVEQLENLEQLVPEPHWPLQLLQKNVAEAYMRAQLTRDFPEEIADNYDRFLSLVNHQIKKLTAPPPSANPAMGAPPPPEQFAQQQDPAAGLAAVMGGASGPMAQG